MSLLDYLGLGGLCGMGHGPLGNPIEDGKRAQEEMIKRHYSESSQVRMCHSGTMKFERDIDGECSVVEIDGKKLLEEIK